MELVVRTFDLKLKHEFTISRETHNVQPTIIVELKQDGFSGFGEATSNPYYNITTDAIGKELARIEPFVNCITNETPELFWEVMKSLLGKNSFALCALDMAYSDLYAKKQGKKLYEYWNYSIDKNPMTNYTIGIAPIDEMVNKMQEMPWPIYKIKLGTPDDIAIVEALRAKTDAIFRIDANCGWTVDQTIDNSIALEKLGVEFIEQPTVADDWKAHKEIFKHSKLPIIADESCIEEDDVYKCLNHFHGINIKLVKCGGLTSARRMIEEAKKLKLKTMIGCMTESTVGISAIAHLLPMLDYVDMDGALLLKTDIASGVIIKDGIIEYSDLNGSGVSLF